MQPALVAHAVLTMEASALVVGWEAGDPLDVERFPQIRSKFAFGLGHEYQQKIRICHLCRRAKYFINSPVMLGNY